MDEQAIIDATRRWVDGFVIGLNLCPFARRVAEAGRIRYTMTAANSEVALLADLARELRALVDTPRATIETTILIHPHALPDFLDFNDFLDAADRVLLRLRLHGVIQIAGFHPAYQFAGTEPGDVENYTNRSPHPMLHLLREDSVTEVADDPDALLDIPQCLDVPLRDVE